MEFTMKKHIISGLALILITISLNACQNLTSQETGAIVGGAAGAGIGSAITEDSAAGPIIGAGAGALLGSEIGRRYEE